MHAGSGGTVNIYGNGSGNIYLRPNGIGTTTGQTYLEPSGDFHITGQQIGGNHYQNPSTTTSRSYSGSSAVISLENVALSKGGQYIVTGNMAYTPSASGQLMTCAFGTTSSNISWGNTSVSNGSYGFFFNVAMNYSPTSDTTIYLNFRASGSGGSISNSYLRAFRIG